MRGIFLARGCTVPTVFVTSRHYCCEKVEFAPHRSSVQILLTLVSNCKSVKQILSQGRQQQEIAGMERQWHGVSGTKKQASQGEGKKIVQHRMRIKASLPQREPRAWKIRHGSKYPPKQKTYGTVSVTGFRRGEQSM